MIEGDSHWFTVGMGYPLGFPVASRFSRENNCGRERALTKRRTRSRLRALQHSEISEKISAKASPDWAPWPEHSLKRKLSPSSPTCTERWKYFCTAGPNLHDRAAEVLCDSWPSQFCALLESNTTPRRATRGERGQKFPLPCFVTARRVNPQECRRRRDPLSTDRSSTKPCGRSPSGTRTYLPSAPVLTDPYGKQLLQSTI